MGFISSLFNIASSRDVPFRQPLQLQCSHHGSTKAYYFSKTEIPVLYNDVKNSVVYQGSQVLFINWTRCAAHSYLTVHFIDKDWTLQSFCLDITPLFDDHTGQNIAEAVKDIYQNWNLPVSGLVATTTDYGSKFFQLTSSYSNLLWS